MEENMLDGEIKEKGKKKKRIMPKLRERLQGTYSQGKNKKRPSETCDGLLFKPV